MVTRVARPGYMTEGAEFRQETFGMGSATGDVRAAIKSVVGAIEPAATVILYGSRARGTAEADSDWDLLILVDGPVDAARKRAIRNALYELEWSCGEVITSAIKSRTTWAEPRFKVSPFYLAVERDGVIL
jgi:predicted nucleotidyltransferase